MIRCVGFGVSLILLITLASGCNGKLTGGTGTGIPGAKAEPLVDPDQKVPPLVVFGEGETTHKFGKMAQESQGKHTFEITNQGEGDLRIRLANTSCGCTSVKFADLEWQPKENPTPPQKIVVVPPGGKLDVELTWNTEMKFGAFRTTAKFESNDSRQPVIDFNIEGEVMPFVETTQTQLNITSARNTETTTIVFFVFSKVKEDLEVTEVTTSHEKVKAAIEPAPDDMKESLSALRAFKCTVSVLPGVPIGPFSASLAIQTNCTERPTVDISLSGTFSGDVAVTPDKLDFSHVAAGQSTVQFVLITVRSDEDVEVSVKRVVPEFLKPTLKRVEQAKNRFRLQVEVPPDAKGGAFQGGVELETNHPGCESVKIPIRGVVAAPLNAAATVSGP
jgi:hypothetical protein